MLEFWTPPSLEGATLLLVSFRQQKLHRTAIRKRCVRLGPITEHLLPRNGKPISRYFTSVASGYRIAATPRPQSERRRSAAAAAWSAKQGSFDKFGKMSAFSARAKAQKPRTVTLF